MALSRQQLCRAMSTSPEAVPPHGTLAVTLLKHQRIALAWMIRKETSNRFCSGGILADDQGLGKTVSTISLILTERSPPPPSLSVTTRPAVCETITLDDDDDDEDGDESNCDMPHPAKKPRITAPVPSPSTTKTTGRIAAGTLVVCPTSVLRQWADELESKVCKEANLSYLVYHGSGRTKDPLELAKYDVVLTTYAIVTMEVPIHPDDKDVEVGGRSKLLSNKRKKQNERDEDTQAARADNRTLGKVLWFRVILDEAQTIKNHRTWVSRACWGLRAKRRWCLSGTPMQNSVDDLFSYFRFLRYEPCSLYSSFVSMIKKPISTDPSTGYRMVQAMLKNIMLRRTKGTLIDGMPIINVPPKTVTLKRVRFAPHERSFYSALESECRTQFKVYKDAGTVKQNYVNILLMLLRLRQACNHPLLVNGCNSSLSTNWRSSIETASKLAREKQERLLSFLEANFTLCGLCNDAPEDAVVTTCGHIFCNQCISEKLTLTGGEDGSLCPKCKSIISLASLFTRSALQSSLLSGGTLVQVEDLIDVKMPNMSCSCTGYSSKIKVALEILHSLPPVVANCGGREEIEMKLFEKKSSVITEKAIVFSQWTSMLDMLEVPLKESGFQYRRLDGTMSVTARENAVKDFNTLPEVRVMLLSLKAASLGLNLVSANHVVLLDPWWNPTTEDQAIDRAHRIGQSRPVSVSRLTVEDTVEDQILDLQKKKREMVASASGEDEMGSQQTHRLTVEDLEYLFR